MKLTVGMMVRVPDSFYDDLHRSCLGLRPDITVPVHDEESPGLVYRRETLVVLRIDEVAQPHRWAGVLQCTDVQVATPAGIIGWIYDYNLEEVT